MVGVQVYDLVWSERVVPQSYIVKLTSVLTVSVSLRMNHPIVRTVRAKKEGTYTGRTERAGAVKGPRRQSSRSNQSRVKVQAELRGGRIVRNGPPDSGQDGVTLRVSTLAHQQTSRIMIGVAHMCQSRSSLLGVRSMAPSGSK